MSGAVPRLLAITPASAGSPDTLLAWARALAGAGVDALQLRDKTLSDGELLRRARGLCALRREGLPRVLVNGRPDVALAAGADGVHLPAAGLEAGAVAGWVGTRLLVGVSTHAVEEVAAARRAGAAYVVFGPIWPTPSKPGWRPAGDRLEELARAAAVGLPVLAIGGVTIDRLGELAAAGAAGVAGIRVFGRPEALPELVAEAGRRFGAERSR
ncbi:MAG: thiamine phosphate synthase [Thermoanaerobaculia bacterium]